PGASNVAHFPLRVKCSPLAPWCRHCGASALVAVCSLTLFYSSILYLSLSGTLCPFRKRNEQSSLKAWSVTPRA
ncbi:hypothetical protein D347_00051, partial [Enterococcus faecalis LA3B-2]